MFTVSLFCFYTILLEKKQNFANVCNIHCHKIPHKKMFSQYLTLYFHLSVANERKIQLREYKIALNSAPHLENCRHGCEYKIIPSVNLFSKFFIFLLQRKIVDQRVRRDVFLVFLYLLTHFN